MPRYYCDYCDTYLTHDSPSVRKQHNAGYKHKANVRTYYQQFEEQQTQSLIDQRIKEHLGQAAAFQQVGVAFNQHMMAQRPRLPMMPMPMPIPGMPPGMRPMVLPRPISAPPGYLPPLNMPPMMAPPGAPPMRPPPNMNSGPAMAPPPMYQSNPPPSTEPYDTFNANSQPPNDSNR